MIKKNINNPDIGKLENKIGSAVGVFAFGDVCANAGRASADLGGDHGFSLCFKFFNKG